jgi:alpha,alpha-trehalase
VLRSILIAALTFSLTAQSPQPRPAPQQSQPSIDAYIHQSWNALQRSMTDCASLADPKLTTEPVLYLPAGEPVPASVRTMQAHCRVDVRSLPRTISHEGDLVPDAVPTPGLLYLPNPYVVPGGRFNEMYGWDSYFILLGELADNRLALARGTVENFFYEIDHYGSILNANRTYYLTRSQPPFLSSMVLAVYSAQLKQNPTEARAWLTHSLRYLLRDHALWISPVHLAGSTGLSRYFDLGHGPVPEMADDSTYYVDAVRWFQAHPQQTPAGYLEPINPSAPQNHCADAANCLHTSFNGETLTPAFYKGDRAMRESGFDTSFRFGPYSGSTQDFAPICLNALLYKYERDIAHIETLLDNPTASARWSRIAAQRKQRINTLLWDPTLGLFVDYNFTTHQRSYYRYLTTFYALWSGLASNAQAKRLAANLDLFERTGGLQMSTQTTGAQWDAPFGWAPTNWLAVEGLARYGYTADAERIAREFTATVRSGFAHDGTIREKYDMDTASSTVTITTGYKANVIGFGWTNGVYLEMQHLLHPTPNP